MNRKLTLAAEAVLIVAAGIFTGTLLAQISRTDVHLAPTSWHSTADDSGSARPFKQDIPPSRHESHLHFFGHSVNTTPARHNL